jgi:hypothetical protein
VSFRFCSKGMFRFHSAVLRLHLKRLWAVLLDLLFFIFCLEGVGHRRGFLWRKGLVVVGTVGRDLAIVLVVLDRNSVVEFADVVVDCSVWKGKYTGVVKVFCSGAADGSWAGWKGRMFVGLFIGILRVCWASIEGVGVTGELGLKFFTLVSFHCVDFFMESCVYPFLHWHFMILFWHPGFSFF